MPVTRRVAYLEEGDVADVRRESYAIFDAHGQRVDAHRRRSSGRRRRGRARTVSALHAEGDLRAAARRRRHARGHRVDRARRCSAPRPPSVLPKVDSVLILACGTSYYSSLVAKQWIETLAKMPCTVEIASEYRYRDSVPNDEGARRRRLAVRRDRRHARRAEACEVARPPAHARDLQRRDELDGAPDRARVPDARRHGSRRCIDEGVHDAARRAVPAGADARQAARPLAADEEAKCLDALRHIPAAIKGALALEPHLIGWAQPFAKKQHALFLGRGLHYPIALEGALKLKEISYIHAEAYPAGELKHGPLALVDADMPVVAIAPNDALLEKLKSNLQEVRARGGELYVVADLDSAISPRRRHPPDPRCRASRAAVADRARRAAAAARVSHRGAARDGRRQAAESREERHGGVTRQRTRARVPIRIGPGRSSVVATRAT